MSHAKTLLAAFAAFALVWAAAAAPASAIRLDDTAFFLEINDTDGDAGVQLFLDGEGWRRMKIFDPDGNKIVDVRAKGGIRQQGITELFFESAEPSFDVQTLDELLALFPAGRYTFQGLTTEGEELTGRARLSHAIPGAPLLVFPVDEPVDPDDATFVWEEVADPPGSEIISYEAIVECELEDIETLFSTIVGPDVTSITVPPEYLGQEGEECKWEVLAKEKTGNQTISEAPFTID